MLVLKTSGFYAYLDPFFGLPFEQETQKNEETRLIVLVLPNYS